MIFENSFCRSINYSINSINYSINRFNVKNVENVVVSNFEINDFSADMWAMPMGKLSKNLRSYEHKPTMNTE